MASLIWRGWAALCLLSGTVVLPLFLEVFSGGTVVRFLALPLRWAWAWWPGRAILRAGWLPARTFGVGLATFTLVLTGVPLLDLMGWTSVHPGWFLAMEWWQRPLYPWVELLPRGYLNWRPRYLWIVAFWTLLEGLAVAAALHRWRPGNGSGQPPPPGS